ncbi:U6 snRNA phosphodiesterase 1 [Sabethes cyaneus]|uniref:U6 snRNA phosphodiesterase 1 n=1 Tax=Sabethes cyaneus TaxID=53552 RepID=UPI00237D4829|nr:U6 snRNA phosphodiesterase 1 [Sabethes cyaneus]
MQNILQYYSSDSDDNENTKPANDKNETKLPLSKNLLRLEKTEEPSTKNVEKHQGRIRTFPHERGIWASYVFIDYNDIDAINDLQQLLVDQVSNDSSLELNRVDNLHLSLTKTFILRHHNIPTFVDNVKSELHSIKRFTILLSDLAVYCNEEHTRTFLAIKIHPNSCGPLENLVEKLDHCMRLYKLPEFYTDRSFHVSILWALGDQRKKLSERLEDLQRSFASFYEEEYCDMNVNVRQIHCKCGNKYYEFDLL